MTMSIKSTFHYVYYYLFFLYSIVMSIVDMYKKKHDFGSALKCNIMCYTIHIIYIEVCVGNEGGGGVIQM